MTYGESNDHVIEMQDGGGLQNLSALILVSSAVGLQRLID